MPLHLLSGERMIVGLLTNDYIDLPARADFQDIEMAGIKSGGVCPRAKATDHTRCQELWVSPETAMSRIAPNAKPTTPRAENTKTCQPFRRVRWGSSKNAVSSLLIVITGNSCARLAQKHQMAPLCLAAGTVHQSSAAPASQNTSTQGRTTKVWEPMP